MRDSSVREMYMRNNPPCPWFGQYQGNRPMYMHGPAPPFHPQPPPLPYHMIQHPQYWQGPGPSRPRGRGYRRGRGNSTHTVGRNDRELRKDLCCRCGERLQNSEEPGIHLCDGGCEVILDNRDKPDTHTDKNNQERLEEEVDARLEKVLENLKDFVRSKYNSVTEALEGYVSEKIGEINALHKENMEEKEMLEKLKTELEEKANKIIKQEEEIKEKQKRLTRDQDVFKKEMKKEREEVCRQWQQLRDEITRMEEMHEIQKGRIKLDVGGHVFTTSMLTLTREEDSMLAAMFSGRHVVMKEDDGCVFIDRDGTHFRHVLNYLRDGGANMECLPKDRQLLKELKKEATYYQLHGLVQQIEKYIY